MKTLFIPIFHSFQSRNILMTGVLDVLREDDSLRIVLLVPSRKIDYYQEIYSSDRLIVEGISLINESKVSQTITLVAKNFHDNNTIYWRQKKRFFSDHNKIIFWLSRVVSKISYIPFIELLIRKLFSLIVDKKQFLKLIKKYKPKVVFLTDIYAIDDVCLGLAAQVSGVKCIGMVRSWDNVSGKGVCLIRPEKIVVNNEILKSEVERFIGLPSRDIEIVGVPQFDYYVDYQPTPRANFFEKNGLNQSDQYILYAPYFGSYLEAANEVLIYMDKCIEKGRLPENLKIAVRMPPSFSPNMTKVYNSQRIIVDYPGVKFGSGDKTDWEFSKSDIIHFADSLYYSQVVISAASTVSIDAAALNRPAINLMFDGDGQKEFAKSFEKASKNDHFKAVLDSGGTAKARSYNELIEQINEYIKNQNKDEEGRMKLIKEQCWKLDGRSSRRLGNFILNQLK